MKLGIFVVLMMGLATEIIAADKPGVKKGKPAPASAPAKATEITIPAGAVEIEPYMYRYTDAAGKNWIYRKTPFGVMRLEEGDNSWEVAGDGLPIVETPGLTIVTSARRLYAATHGMGIWYLNLQGGHDDSDEQDRKR